MSHIGHVVVVAAHVAEAHHNRLDLLVAEHASRAAAPGLLDAGFLAAHGVIPANVEAADARVFAALPGRDHRYVAPVRFALRVHLGQLLADQVRINRFQRSLFDGHAAGVAVDQDDDVLVGLALDLERIQTGKLQKGPK